MKRRHWLAVLPVLGMLGGIPFANRVEPYVFGMPFLLAWIVCWVVAMSLILALIFVLDSAAERSKSAVTPVGAEPDLKA
ncbi:MAG: DUF3311 domain-containing protein [Gemmatimonadota bacterium]|nr:DUF3311 domain-containing protein [Gemmatimonadota bacterium]